MYSEMRTTKIQKINYSSPSMPGNYPLSSGRMQTFRDREEEIKIISYQFYKITNCVIFFLMTKSTKTQKIMLLSILLSFFLVVRHFHKEICILMNLILSYVFITFKNG